MTIEDVRQRIYEIHDVIDVEVALITLDELSHASEEKLRMYGDLVERTHNMLVMLGQGISNGVLPKSIYTVVPEGEEPKVREFCFAKNWNHHFRKEDQTNSIQVSDIRAIIRDKMKKDNITQEQLAKRIGRDQSLITRFLAGVAVADKTLERICEELQIPYYSLERERLLKDIEKLNAKYIHVLEGEEVVVKCKSST